MTGPSGWHTGDLGRFAADANDDAPQFEAVSASRAGVTVWYHLAPKPETIPVDVFKRDYTNTWVLKKAVPKTHLVSGAVLTMPTTLDKLAAMHAERDMDAIEPDDYRSLFENIVRTPPGMRQPFQIRVGRKPAEKPNRPSTRDLIALERMRGRNVRVRHIRLNYCSCELVDQPSLILITTAVLEEWGSPRVTLWDHLDAIDD